MTRPSILMTFFLIACLLFGALLMHLFTVGLAIAQDDGVIAPGPMSPAVDAIDAAAPEIGKIAAAPPAVTSESTPEEVAEAAWWALQAGYVGPGLILIVFAGGAVVLKRKGYIIKRWPRLNDGRAWAVVAIVTSTSVTLLPLAIAETAGEGTLTFRVVFFHAATAFGLWIKSHLGGVTPIEVVVADAPGGLREIREVR
jgi:hypothetical protein